MQRNIRPQLKWRTFWMMLLISFSATARTISVGLNTKMEFVDPFDLGTLEQFEIAASYLDTLIEFQDQGGFRPALASTWSYDPKDQSLKFKLKKDLKFSDGTPLTAEDVVFTLKRIVNLDKEGDMAVTRCVAGKTRATEKVLAKAISAHLDEVVLKGVTCVEQLLKEIAEANYGILKKGSSPNRKMTSPPREFSGAFVPTFNGQKTALRLNPNEHNWRAKLASIADVSTFDVRTTINVDSRSISTELDAFRTTEASAIAGIESAGFKIIKSLPIMSWYVAVWPKTDSENVVVPTQLVEDLNHIIRTSELRYFKDNLLESRSLTFFPEDLNCDKPKGFKSMARSERKKYQLSIISNPSGESLKFDSQIAELLKSSGYEIGNKESGSNIELRITRQFLGDGTLNVLSLALIQLGSIFDPQKIISSKIERAEAMPSDKQGPAVAKICDEFSGWHHIPLAIRRYAFAYKVKDAEKIFLANSGNILFSRAFD